MGVNGHIPRAMPPDSFRNRIKVLFVIHYLAGGGAERVVIRILRLLNREKFVPVLLMIENRGVFRADVPQDVPVYDCGRYGDGGRWLWLRNFVRLLRQEKPDVVVSFLWFTNLVTIISRFFSGVRCRLIVSERSTIVGSRSGILNESLRRLTVRFLYPFADRILVNSRALQIQLSACYHHPETKVTVLHNPLDIETINAHGKDCVDDAEQPEGPPIIVGMGRLGREKGFDLLVRAAAAVRNPFRMVLLGEGVEKNRLRDLVKNLGIDGYVEFAGFRKNPFSHLSMASIFVLPSRYEGFPNSLLEAMALGVACVATRCPTGPEEIVTDEVDGLLVPVEDPGALAVAIDRLLGSPMLRERLGRAARERVRAFDAPGIILRLEDLIEEVVE